MYTPPLSDYSVVSLRRLARAMHTTMGCAFDRIVRLMPAMVDPAFVCRRCRDASKCGACVFNTPVSGSEKAALTAT